LTLQEQLLLALYEESALELVLLVASHADERPFRADAPLLLDLLAEVYKVRSCQFEFKICYFLLFQGRG
jgi:hypothetical protein